MTIVTVFAESQYSAVPSQSNIVPITGSNGGNGGDVAPVLKAMLGCCNRAGSSYGAVFMQADREIPAAVNGSDVRPVLNIALAVVELFEIVNSQCSDCTVEAEEHDMC